MTGYSRIYDDDHYLSQVLLGYCVAVLAVEATELTERSPFQYRVVPLNARGGVGLGIAPVSAAALLPLVAAGATQLPIKEIFRIVKRLLLL